LPTGPPPTTQQALQEAWQRYRAQQGVHGVTPQQPSQQTMQTDLQRLQRAGVKPIPNATLPSGSSFLHALHPSSIRVDFHPPPEPAQ
jgi:hypothetical protein